MSTEIRVTGLPSTLIYAQIGVKVSGAWAYTNATFTTRPGSVVVAPTIPTTPIPTPPPPPGSTSPDGPIFLWPRAGQTWVDLDTWVEWSEVSKAQAYHLRIGRSAGGNDLFDSGDTSRTEQRVNGLPRGTTVYAQVGVKVNGVWGYTTVIFTTRP